jgi:hypothetical protein
MKKIMLLAVAAMLVTGTVLTVQAKEPKKEVKKEKVASTKYNKKEEAKKDTTKKADHKHMAMTKSKSSSKK